MKIVATNEKLELKQVYDLGESGEDGPDHAEFNRDIATSVYMFMDWDEYILKCQAKSAGEKRVQEARASFLVFDGSV